MDASERSKFLKSIANASGFSFCGISNAVRLDEEAVHLERWLKQNRHGTMQYMEQHFDKRIDPAQLVVGAKSVVSLMYNYYPKQEHHPQSIFKISKYAFGEDYHQVIKRKLQAFIARLQKQWGDFQARIFVDSAPVLEKAWAKRSGIGWTGKNTNLINPKSGSFFFLAEIICDVELEPDGPIKDYCGTCTACIDACPTDALHDPYFIDASKCISYLTIELKEDHIPSAFRNQTDNWIFGCDICQDVCPWNRFSTPHQEPAFDPSSELLSMTNQDWMEITEDIFRGLFRKSAVQRAKLKGLKRNIEFSAGEKKMDDG